MIALELTQQEVDALEALLRHFDSMKSDVGSYDSVVDLIADRVGEIVPCPSCALAEHLSSHLDALEELTMSAIALRPFDFVLQAVTDKLQSAAPPRKARIA